MTAAPTWAPTDDETASLLSLLSDDPDYDRFLLVCQTVAEFHGGLVRVNDVRDFIERHGIDFEPRHFSAYWSRATGKGGPMRFVVPDDGLPMWETCKPTKTGRNGGKPQRNRKWVG